MREDKAIDMTLEEFWDLPVDESIYNIRIQYKGHTFAAGVYKHGREKTIWADKGATMCYGFDTYSPIERVKHILDIYASGKYICQRCGKIIDKNDSNSYERIFAGIYCKDCWTPEDAIAREEAYRD